MSRSNPQSTSSNPSQRFFEWGGETGELTYYDKEVSEKITVKPPFVFMVLDELSTITGFDNKNKCGVYSNEIKDTKTEPLNVRSFKGGDIAKGIYLEIKDKINAAGYKYTKSIYIAFKDKDVLKIGNIKLTGAALNSWIEFSSNNKQAVAQKAISIVDKLTQTTGRIEYCTPVFEAKEITEKTNAEAIQLDIELQNYLLDYFGKARPTQTSTNESVEKLKEVFDAEEMKSDDLPF